MASRLKPALTGALCLGFSVSCTLGLWHLLHAPRQSAEPLVVTRVKLSARAVVVVRPPAPTAPAAPAVFKVLPLRGTLAAPRKTLPKPAVAVPSVEVAPPVSVLPEPQELPTLSQPMLPTPLPRVEPQDLPVIASLDAPPVPPLEPDPASPAPPSAVVPGGDTLVLGLLLYDTGTVINAKVLVRSKEPLSDISLVMAHIGLRWTDFSPPLEPGEQRWIERRMDFGPKSAVFTPLP